MNIENIKLRLKYCKDKLHYCESSSYAEELQEEILILETVVFASEWEGEQDDD